MSKTQVEFQSEAYKLYGFNYSLTYKNIFVSTCVAPTLLNKSIREKNRFQRILRHFNQMCHCNCPSRKSKGIFNSLRMPIFFTGVLKGKAIRDM